MPTVIRKRRNRLVGPSLPAAIRTAPIAATADASPREDAAPIRQGSGEIRLPGARSPSAAPWRPMASAAVAIISAAAAMIGLRNAAHLVASRGVTSSR